MVAPSKRASSTSFNTGENASEANEEDAVQLEEWINLQNSMAQASRKSGCWGHLLPVPFERASPSSWWDPAFDSDILEEQYRKSVSTHHRLKFRYALWYILLLSTSWFFYFLSTGESKDASHAIAVCAGLAVIIIVVVSVLTLTYKNFYVKYTSKVALPIALSLCTLNLLVAALLPLRSGPTGDVSPAGHFSICVEVLLLIYTLIPIRLYMCLIIGLLHSVTFELLVLNLHETSPGPLLGLVRALAHLCIHLIGLHILIMTNVRMRNTFMKVGQSLLVRKQLESEKKLKVNMINSLMPPAVANWILNEDERFAGTNYNQTMPIQSLFRPFNMNRMENVSILFADIVGFTRMASNKSAEELVDILNCLFRRFDLLCKMKGCEKISTLGDCYYCVSGCPEARLDHAICCVEMGLSMITQIRMFDEEKNEGVNMRVGVHTGTILCGFVGSKRFKFDVWSNDVSLANRMEATGKPGMVHISEKTLSFLPDSYFYDEGQPVLGLKTYFILGRKSDRPPSYSGSMRRNETVQNSLQLIISPPTSPPAMSPQTRPRVLSCDTSSGFMKPSSPNPNMLSPDVCKIKASSLPSILDSENEQEEGPSKAETECVKTPTSTASSGRYSVKLKKIKVPKFLRKSQQKAFENSAEAPVFDDAAPPATVQGGYQQVPIVIESQADCITKKGTSWNSLTNIDDAIFLDQEEKDGIDVKSYISQSRSDIGGYDTISPEMPHFLRTGSYRSNYGRAADLAFLSRTGSNRSRREKSPNIDLPPTERTRSATVAVPNMDRPKKTSLEVPSRLSSIADDHLITAHSISSRKDSGIKSNSRRSSIQMESQLPLGLNDQHRVSGYYTSSQSSINSPYSPKPYFEKNVQTLRKQSDRQLIKCVQDNSRSEQSYFIKPPLSKVSLFFADQEMERQYRNNVHSVLVKETIPTLANAKYNTYLDVFVSAIVFIIISICLFVIRIENSAIWMSFFGLFIFVQMCAVALCFPKVVKASERVFGKICSRWYRWNAFGGVLVSIPLALVLIYLLCRQDASDYLFVYLIFVGIIHFCNFTQLNCWMKNILATVFCAIFVGSVASNLPVNSSFIELSCVQTQNCTEEISAGLKNGEMYFQPEVLMDVLLLLVLVWVLNREFEIGYRMSFHANFVATRDKTNMLTLKNQADWLIYHIVPEHVAEKLKQDAKYSENFKDVAIIFATVVNFNEMYDESYMGGKEYLRVLNELISDFDELLNRTEFQSVEKIKTIGSTFMAASGLDSSMREPGCNEHLFDLMEFALAMQKVVQSFNRDLLGFDLILRIGYNFGDVTAAVIGKTKLYYDIWGDAVNIASRMDSTGVNERIQVGERCLEVLSQRYEFEKRGSIYVKGKDHMNVYLWKGKKEIIYETPSKGTKGGKEKGDEEACALEKHQHSKGDVS